MLAVCVSSPSQNTATSTKRAGAASFQISPWTRARWITAAARLMHDLQSLLAVKPDAFGHHPAPRRLTRQSDAVALHQFLGRERRAEIGIPLPNRGNGELADCRRGTAIACPAA